MRRIERVWLFVAEDEEGEGLIGFRDARGQWLPLVCADEERLRSVRGLAEQVAHQTGTPVHLIEFSTRTDLGPIGGKPT